MLGKLFLFGLLVFFLIILGGLFVVRGIAVEMQEQGIPVDDLGQLFFQKESFPQQLEGLVDDSQINSSQNTIDSSKITSKEATDAYQDYIDAYNKLTELMSEGKGDTPEGQQAYREYKEAKEKYEAIAQSLSN